MLRSTLVGYLYYPSYLLLPSTLLPLFSLCLVFFLYWLLPSPLLPSPPLLPSVFLLLPPFLPLLLPLYLPSLLPSPSPSSFLPPSSPPSSLSTLPRPLTSQLYNIVVDTEDTGKQLLQKGQLKRRYTIIPLSKISARTISNDVVKKAQALVGGALNYK